MHLVIPTSASVDSGTAVSFPEVAYDMPIGEGATFLFSLTFGGEE